MGQGSAGPLERGPRTLELESVIVDMTVLAARPSACFLVSFSLAHCNHPQCHPGWPAPPAVPGTFSVTVNDCASGPEGTPVQGAHLTEHSGSCGEVSFHWRTLDRFIYQYPRLGEIKGLLSVLPHSLFDIQGQCSQACMYTRKKKMQGLLKYKLLDSRLKVSHPLGLGGDPRICISSNISEDAIGPRAPLRTSALDGFL